MTVSVSGLVAATSKVTFSSAAPVGTAPVVTSTSVPALSFQDGVFPTVGSQSWTISGTNFTGMTSVVIGTTDITSYCVVTSPTLITVTFPGSPTQVPAPQPEQTDQAVVVTTPGGTSNSDVTVYIDVFFN